MNRPTPQRPARPARKDSDPLVNDLNELIDPFGWKICINGSNSMHSLTDDHRVLLRELVDYMCQRKNAYRFPRSVPDCFWRVVLIPFDASKQFRHVSDARALLYFAVSTTDRFSLWRNMSLSGGVNDASLSEVVIEAFSYLPMSEVTPAGAIYQKFERGVQSVWFGRFTGRESTPSLSGPTLINAMRALFRIGGGAP